MPRKKRTTEQSTTDFSEPELFPPKPSSDFKVVLFSEAPYSSFLHKDPSEGELIANDELMAPEGHSSSILYCNGKLMFLWVGGVFPENPIRSQNNDSLYRTIFQRDHNGAVYQFQEDEKGEENVTKFYTTHAYLKTPKGTVKTQMTGSGLEPHCYSDMVRVKDKFYLFHGYLPAQSTFSGKDTRCDACPATITVYWRSRRTRKAGNHKLSI